ncbi:MAG: hypothetical protein Dbin4_02625 [Alphaproteobacteria bacterium]|nr:hypothetical protein [Alphaproteobacteria bacterium]
MSHRLTDEIFAGMQAQSTAYQSALERGVLIGRREMKPLIRELCDEMESLIHFARNCGMETVAPYAVLARAKEALEND